VDEEIAVYMPSLQVLRLDMIVVALGRAEITVKIMLGWFHTKVVGLFNGGWVA